MNILRVELNKLFTKKTTLIAIVSFILLPILFVLLMKSGNSAIRISGKINEMTLSFTIWDLLKTVFVSYLVIIVLTTSNLGKELSNHSANMYLVRTTRTKYFLTKTLANVLLNIIIYCLFFISSYLMTKFLLADESYYGGLTFTAVRSSYLFLINAAEIILFTVMAQLFAAMAKNSGGTIATMLVLVASKVFSNIKFVAKYLPTKLADLMRILEISGDKRLLKDAGRSLIFIVCYILIALIIGILIFKRKDIK